MCKDDKDKIIRERQRRERKRNNKLTSYGNMQLFINR